MKALEKRATELARETERTRLSEVEAHLGEALPAAEIKRSRDAIEVSGQGLLRAWLEDASLRFIARRRR